MLGDFHWLHLILASSAVRLRSPAISAICSGVENGLMPLAINLTVASDSLFSMSASTASLYTKAAHTESACAMFMLTTHARTAKTVVIERIFFIFLSFEH